MTPFAQLPSADGLWTGLRDLDGTPIAIAVADAQIRWLGAPDALTEGAWADLVVYDSDPRPDIEVTRHPRLVILRGRVMPRH